MRLLGGTHDRVYRAGLNTECAAYARLLINHRNGAGLIRTMNRIEGYGTLVQQNGQPADTIIATWRTLVDVRAPFGATTTGLEAA